MGKKDRMKKRKNSSSHKAAAVEDEENKRSDADDEMINHDNEEENENYDNEKKKKNRKLTNSTGSALEEGNKKDKKKNKKKSKKEARNEEEDDSSDDDKELDNDDAGAGDAIATVSTSSGTTNYSEASGPVVKPGFFATETFQSLPLSDTTQEALKAMGYNHMTKIQAKSIPSLLSGKDLIGAAKTGSGTSQERKKEN